MNTIGWIILGAGIYILFVTTFTKANGYINEFLFKFIPLLVGITEIICGLILLNIIKI